MALGLTESTWRAPTDLPDLTDVDIMSIDTETFDPDLKKFGAGWPMKHGQLAGIAVGAKKGGETRGWYLPFGHFHGEGLLSKKYVLNWARKNFSTRCPKVFHNGMYDIGWLSTEDVKVEGKIYDTMFAASLLDEHKRSYSLENVAQEYLGVGKDERVLREAAREAGLDPKAAIALLPCKYSGAYAEEDAVVTLDLWFEIKKEIEKENLWEVFDLECDLIPLLVEMRKRGVRVDLDRAEQTKGEFVKEQRNLLNEIQRMTGVEVNLWEPTSLAKAFDKLSISYPRTPKTSQPSFIANWLESHPHKLPKLVVQARRLDKQRRDFVEMILKKNHKGRIHSEFHPLKSDEGGAVSGRFSSTNPNLQQITGRDPYFTPLIRGLFIPEEGEVWGQIDYTAQEPRLTVHYAYLTKQLGAAEAVKRYIEDPTTDYHQMVADMCGISRKHAKIINLGIAYGMGGLSLCLDLGLPLEEVTLRNGDTIQVPGPEGKALLKKYHEQAPFISGIFNFCEDLADKRGWIKTIAGRKARFDLWEPAGKGHRGLALPLEAAKKQHRGPLKRAFTHKALNRLIQGSAADMTKIAMLNMWKEGIVPLISMHDELDLSCPNKKFLDRCSEIMMNSVDLKVPVLVDVEVGDNWGNVSEDYQWPM